MGSDCGAVGLALLQRTTTQLHGSAIADYHANGCSSKDRPCRDQGSASGSGGLAENVLDLWKLSLAAIRFIRGRRIPSV